MGSDKTKLKESKQRLFRADQLALVSALNPCIEKPQLTPGIRQL